LFFIGLVTKHKIKSKKLHVFDTFMYHKVIKDAYCLNIPS